MAAEQHALNEAEAKRAMGWASYQEDIMSRYAAARRPTMKVAHNSRIDKPARMAAPKEEPMTELKDFVIQTARPLPVILLADVSGSMKENGKIDALNEAVANMISAFSEEDTTRAEIQLAVIAFGAGGARVHRSLGPATSGDWAPLIAKGPTPLGAALELAKNLIEDREQIPSRAYCPTLILISDGHPTGPDGKPTTDWRSSLQSILESERASKAVRFAMAIGDDADKDVLNAFLADPSRQVFTGSQARQIKQFFRWVTMSVTARSRSINPNTVIFSELTDEELDY